MNNVDLRIVFPFLKDLERIFYFRFKSNKIFFLNFCLKKNKTISNIGFLITMKFFSFPIKIVNCQPFKAFLTPELSTFKQHKTRDSYF